MQVNLDVPLPAEIGVGAGTVLFLAGTCFDAERTIEKLELAVCGGPGETGAPQPVAAHGMPRLDYLRALHPQLDPAALLHAKVDPDAAEDPFMRSYRSGFWGFVRIGPAAAGVALELMLRASFKTGEQSSASLGSVRVAIPPEPAPLSFPGPRNEPRVAICMATYEPPLDLLRRQLQSIRSQTHGNWVCVISDDCSSPERSRALRELVNGDPRFVVSRSPRRLGFYRNFERVLSLVPQECDYIALADQDDRWYADKLAALLATIGDAQLAYSDARLVSRDGDVLTHSYWERRQNNHTDLLALLLANSVTGAASLFRRALLDYALPFPPAQFAHYHDHWLALVALGLGEIEYLDRPLYDYVQHGHAALGHAAANRITPLSTRLRHVRDDPGDRVRVSRTRYFTDLIRMEAFATVLELRCGGRMPARRLHNLRRFLGLERSWPALAWLAGRAARELARPRPQTLGSELPVMQAVLWRRALSATTRQHPQRHLRLDAAPPPDLALRAGGSAPAVQAVREIAEKIAPLALEVSEEAPLRVNVLIPRIDLEHLFGGYIAKLNLASRLAERGARVRLLTVDPVGPLPRDWQARLQSYSGLHGLLGRVEVAFGRSGGVEVNRDDAFIATTWWTAHIAEAARAELSSRPFVYLVQEYEPFTFPMSSYAALAEQSYGFEHFALFSTELLRGFFRARHIGVYAGGPDAGDRTSASFQNAITAIASPDQAMLASRRPRRLLLYARPEAHAARNMFELALMALGRAVGDGSFRGWELHGIGSLGAARRVALGDGAELELLPRRPQADYGQVLTEHDVGLALMYTPHPSLVPIEMASAGMLTVTNTFENKSAEALRAISPNLIAADPTIDEVAAALREAAAGAEDVERRTRGAAVDWSRDWRDSFEDRLLEWVEAVLFGR